MSMLEERFSSFYSWGKKSRELGQLRVTQPAGGWSWHRGTLSCSFADLQFWRQGLQLPKILLSVGYKNSYRHYFLHSALYIIISVFPYQISKEFKIYACDFLLTQKQNVLIKRFFQERSHRQVLFLVYWDIKLYFTFLKLNKFKITLLFLRFWVKSLRKKV